MALSKAIIKRDLHQIKKAIAQNKKFIDSTNQPSQSTLERWLKQLTALQEEFLPVRKSIWDVLYDDSHSEKAEYTTLFEPDTDFLDNEIPELILKVEGILSEARKTQSPEPSLPSSEGSNGTPAPPQVKLPQIQLPRFDGSPEKFTEFYNSFDSICARDAHGLSQTTMCQLVKKVSKKLAEGHVNYIKYSEHLAATK
ncbi:hypothetical protein WDU94_010762 [Cyamophila willieti]